MKSNALLVAIGAFSGVSIARELEPSAELSAWYDTGAAHQESMEHKIVGLMLSLQAASSLTEPGPMGTSRGRRKVRFDSVDGSRQRLPRMQGWQGRARQGRPSSDVPMQGCKLMIENGIDLVVLGAREFRSQMTARPLRLSTSRSVWQLNRQRFRVVGLDGTKRPGVLCHWTTRWHRFCRSLEAGQADLPRKIAVLLRAKQVA